MGKSDREDRIIDVLVAAYNACGGDKIRAQLMAAQAMLESGLHKVEPSALATQANNFFGIKGKGDAGSVMMVTNEFFKGVKQRIKAPFAAFSSPEKGFEGHVKVLEHPRYDAVHEAGSFEEAAAAIKKAGYATDPKYTSLLKGIKASNIDPFWEQAMKRVSEPKAVEAASTEGMSPAPMDIGALAIINAALDAPRSFTPTRPQEFSFAETGQLPAPPPPPASAASDISPADGRAATRGGR